MDNGDGAGGADGGRVLFSACKGETHTHKQGLKQLYRRLRSMYRPEAILSRDDLTTSNLSGAAMVVFGCPKEMFSTTEFNVLRKYVENGGSVLILMSEGGEMKAGTNINYWLEEYGMSVNADAVLRTTHYKYMHPKEVLIGDGILNRGILDAVGKGVGQQDQDDDFRVKARSAFDGTGLEFVYPHGCTVSALKPAIPILSSGKIAYPMNRPLGERLCRPATPCLMHPCCMDARTGMCACSTVLHECTDKCVCMQPVRKRARRCMLAHVHVRICSNEVLCVFVLCMRQACRHPRKHACGHAWTHSCT